LKYLIAIVTVFFAAFGALSLLNEWSEKSHRPVKWAGLSAQRRSFLIMMSSFIAGISYGSWSWYDKSRQETSLSLLFELEVLLSQLEGLVNVCIAQRDIRQSIGPMTVLVDRIGKYGFKAARLMQQLESLLPADDYQELKRGAMAITVGLDSLQSRSHAGPPDQDDIDSLINMQSGIRHAKSQTRRLINERTTNS
jgi:hypothetical protein